MKISKNFLAEEFLPPSIYNTYMDNSTWFLKKETVKAAQFVRDYFEKPMTINNYHSGGTYTERGFRVPESTTGTKLTQHKLCNAFDFNIKGVTPDEIREEILKHPEPFMHVGITTLEHSDYAPTWVHADLRWSGLDKILIVKPAAISLLSAMHTDEYFIYEKGKLVPYVCK